MLEAVAQAEGNPLPCVRSYENDMARLSLSGAVAFEQALTAAAADGGKAAGEHVSSGLPAMVIETVYPGPDDEHSTVSTRLFLPARKVKEKARKLRSSLSEDILSSTNSRNILAMTFRQVVIQQLWNYDLAIFVPGSQRNMEDLGSQREVAASFSLSSSDERVISRLAEAVCILALDSTQEEFMNGSSGKALDGFFNWFSKPKQFTSNDSSVVIFRYEDEIVENAKSLLEKFNMVRAKYKMTNKKLRRSAWPSLMHSKLEKIGGPEFSIWAREYVPAYRVEIDADRLTDLKLEGWKRTTGNKWEIFLTHSQMVGLGNIIDMYFEDVYTLPSKQLSCDVDGNPKKLSRKMQRFSLFGFLRTLLITASFVLTVGLMVKLWLPRLYNLRRRDPGEHQLLASSESVHGEVHLSLDSSKLEAFCSATVGKIKDYYGWSGDIKFEPSVGAWIGELPIYFRTGVEADSRGRDISPTSDVLATSGEEQKSFAQDIASYQVFLSSDGRIVRLQPTNEAAVNQWSTNPLAKELHGLLEPGAAIRKPDEVLVLELLMSQSQDNFFSLVRRLQ